LRGFQDVTKQWLDLIQGRLQKNVEGMTKLSQCRSLSDLAAVQTELLRQNMQEMIDGTKQLAQRSVKIADDAGRTINAASQGGAEGSRRAA